MVSCDRCQRQKQAEKVSRYTLPYSSQIQVILLNANGFNGPLPETTRGNKYIVTVTDYFLKWAEAALLPLKHAVGISKFIYSVIFFAIL